MRLHEVISGVAAGAGLLLASSALAQPRGDVSCAPYEIIFEPMPLGTYSIERTAADGLAELWIQVPKTWESYEFSMAGFRYTDGDQIRIAGQLDFTESSDASPERLATLLVVEQSLVQHIEIYVNYTHLEQGCTIGRTFVFDLDGSPPYR